MTTHVFIVDSTTFNLHLQHQFAGTGAKDYRVDFNRSWKTALHHSVENMLVGMIADASRVRRGDHIIFYLQQDFARGIREGKFFGVFRATSDGSFLDDNDGKQYLRGELGKSLTFRVQIEPHTVYAEGVTEWEALDDIRALASPNQMLWSLIYRKLKGNRGNTMITGYEADRLNHLLRNKNGRLELDCGEMALTFDAISQRISPEKASRRVYQGRREPIDIVPRLVEKWKKGNAFEAHLQAYITQFVGRGVNESLDRSLLGSASEIEWIGNEVSCGVGMQRIDIMLSVVERGQRTVIPIELKAVEADERNVLQLQRYVDWIEQYYVPNRPSDVRPILLAMRTENKGTTSYKAVRESIRRFNDTNAARCHALRVVELSVSDSGLSFEQVAY